MAFSAYKDLEFGEMFRHRERIWVKVPTMEVDGVPFNAFTPVTGMTLQQPTKLRSV